MNLDRKFGKISCSSMPSIGDIVSGTCNQEWIKSINNYLSQTGGGTLFAKNQSDDMRVFTEDFIEKVILPETRTRETIKVNLRNTTNIQMKVINSYSKLEEGVPMAMQLPLLMESSLRKLYEEKQIFGFGIPLDKVPEDDVWGDMIKAGTYDMPDEHEEVTEEQFITWEWDLDRFPYVSLEELKAVEKTRDFFKYILAKTKLDPTNFPNHRGICTEVIDASAETDKNLN